MLFTGSGLTLSKSLSKKLRGHLGKSCAKGNITRRSFQEAEPEVLSALRFLGKVTADIAIYISELSVEAGILLCACTYSCSHQDIFGIPS